jgi:hypothetical protein
MPRRKKKTLSLFNVSVMLFFGVVLRTLMLLPSNEDFVLENSAMIKHMDQNPPEAIDLQFHGPDGIGRNQSIVFVHVGKCGGETIQWRVKLSCKLRRSRMLKEECLEYFKDREKESFLSKATIGYLHCDKLRPRESLHNSTAFMVSIRNPVDRIVSWFQYMHPNNCVPNRPSGACNLKKDNNPWGVNFYQTCFPEINDFVGSLGSSDSVVKESTDCSALALETVQGKGPEGKSRRPAPPRVKLACNHFAQVVPRLLHFICYRYCRTLEPHAL